ncbi:hypothetical protein B0H15DRAFT_806223 [Mycena belliarum]|nr:hypothetical protein B0H15DRAFT_806223 [Mycena belliae]
MSSKPSKRPKSAPELRAAEEERKFMQRFYSQSYHHRNRAERNAKTRERMAALRSREATLPEDAQEARLEARRASARKYREKNAWRLARKAREARAQVRERREAERPTLAEARAACRRRRLAKAARREAAELEESICIQSTLLGDLQQGERYSWVDNAFGTALSPEAAAAEQKKRKLSAEHRCDHDPLRPPGSAVTIGCPACPHPISHTLAEKIERDWAALTPQATRQIGRGQRSETMQDVWPPRTNLAQQGSSTVVKEMPELKAVTDDSDGSDDGLPGRPYRVGAAGKHQQIANKADNESLKPHGRFRFLWCIFPHPPLSPKLPKRAMARCEPPWHPDKEGDDPVLSDKLYLATGPHLGSAAGAYNSWNSAQRVVSGSSGATAPLYTSWDSLVAAWDAGCGKGGHTHTLDGATPRRTAGGGNFTTISIGGRTFENVPVLPPVRRAASVAPPSPASRAGSGTASGDVKLPRKYKNVPATPTKTKTMRNSAATPASPSSPRAYSVRWDEEGVVCGSQDEATALYSSLEALGLSPSMMTTTSLVNAANFAEGSGVASLGTQRRAGGELESSDSDVKRKISSLRGTWK